MVVCVVCQYWSERLRETRKHLRSEKPPEEEKRLIAAFQTHQLGACACRFPELLEGLVKQELAVRRKPPVFCDPVRVRVWYEAVASN
jgi:hypothetical protein